MVVMMQVIDIYGSTAAIGDRQCFQMVVFAAVVGSDGCAETYCNF
jgi:hypothetical protein